MVDQEFAGALNERASAVEKNFDTEIFRTTHQRHGLSDSKGGSARNVTHELFSKIYGKSRPDNNDERMAYLNLLDMASAEVASHKYPSDAEEREKQITAHLKEQLKPLFEAGAKDAAEPSQDSDGRWQGKTGRPCRLPTQPRGQRGEDGEIVRKEARHPRHNYYPPR